MKTSKWQFIAGLAVCALCLATAAATKKQITRPFAERVHQVVVADLGPVQGLVPWDDFPLVHWVIREETGQATHLGRIVSKGEGWFNVLTGDSSGSGHVTTASGDILAWTMKFNDDGTATTIFEGLTGRFTGAVGSATGVITVEGVTYEGDGRYEVRTQTFEAKGLLSY
jgi:hypothetical protein